MSDSIGPSRFDRCAGCGREVQRSRTSAAAIYCRECRKAGKAPSSAKHGTDRRYKLGCRCDTCRDHWNERCRAAGRRQRERGYVRPGRKPKAQCNWCGNPVSSARSDNPMHKECRWAWRSAVERRANRRRAAQEKLDRSAAGTPANPNWPFTMGTCRFCDETFVRRNTPSPYCSSKCRRADAPKPVRPSVRRAVFERDGYVCQLCFEPTEPNSDPLSDWYPTVDHIVPQSAGGTHEIDNLRCCHRWCNSVRGDESFYTAADLIA